MKITEIFRSLQGEGKNQGKPCLFIRLGRMQPELPLVRYTGIPGQGEGR